jgi:hypothetical protein
VVGGGLGDLFRVAEAWPEEVGAFADPSASLHMAHSMFAANR